MDLLRVFIGIVPDCYAPARVFAERLRNLQLLRDAEVGEDVLKARVSRDTCKEAVGVSAPWDSQEY